MAARLAECGEGKRTTEDLLSPAYICVKNGGV